jgi:hypothetical protein
LTKRLFSNLLLFHLSFDFKISLATHLPAKMDSTFWNNESALEWHQVFTEWSSLNGSHFNAVADIADTLRRLNRRLATLQRSSRMTNAQMNSRLITLCQQMGYQEMSRDLIVQEGAFLFSNDERAWLSFDEVADRYVNFEAWRRQDNGNNGATRVRSNDSAPPRSTSLEQNMRSVSLHDRGPSSSSSRHGASPSQGQNQWEQAPAYSEEPSFDYYTRDEKRDAPPTAQPQQRPEAQKRALQRSGTQRAFDFMARSSVAPSLPDINIVGHDDPLAPPPPLLSPRQIKDKRSHRKSMRYDTEEFMS